MQKYYSCSFDRIIITAGEYTGGEEAQMERVRSLLILSAEEAQTRDLAVAVRSLHDKLFKMTDFKKASDFSHTNSCMCRDRVGDGCEEWKEA